MTRSDDDFDISWKSERGGAKKIASHRDGEPPARNVATFEKGSPPLLPEEGQPESEEIRLADQFNRVVRGLGSAARSLLIGAWHRSLGNYAVDEYGFDPQFYSWARLFSRFLYSEYWRCENAGIENIPATGPVLIAANHTSVLPWEGEMLREALPAEVLRGRKCWLLYTGPAARLPFVGAYYSRTGRVLQHEANVRGLLARGDVVVSFPEGERGMWKKRQDAHRILHFYDSYLLSVSREQGAPIVPACIYGAVTAYPTLSLIRLPGKPLGLRYLPITPFFPALPPPWCFVPLPGHWRIRFGRPLSEPNHTDAALAQQELSESCRREIRQCLLEILRAGR